MEVGHRRKLRDFGCREEFDDDSSPCEDNIVKLKWGLLNRGVLYDFSSSKCLDLAAWRIIGGPKHMARRVPTLA